MSRISFNMLILFSITLLPWYSYALFIVAGFFLFDYFYEGIGWGIFIDLTFGVSGFAWAGTMWFSISTIILYVVIDIMKRSMSWYV